MAEPRRIDEEDEITPPNVAERRPPSRDTDTRRQLLHDEPSRSAESDAVLLPESTEVARSATNTEIENRNAAAQPAASVRSVRNDAETAVEQPVSLFADNDVSDYRGRWSSIQTAFVDEPRKAVEDADNLVKSVLNKLSDSFTQERETLANQWGRGGNVSTEDLRITLRRYRSFFDRLLNV
jgi:hypothetical protein